MSEPLKISILDKTDSQEFEQLVMLLKKFTIDTFVRNKPEYADLRGKQKNEIVNEAIQEYEERSELSVLTPQDIEQLKKDIESQISSAKELIEKRTNGNTETRYYVMTDEDRMVSFQQVQLSSGKVDERVEGWRNLAYISQDYAGKGGEVIDSSGNLQNSLYSKIIFDDIDRWFEENGVNYERTCTGVNMLQNINAYITAMGFLPFSKNDKNIFLEKFKEHTVSRTALKRAYSLYCQHRQREESRNKKQLLDEIEKIPEFGELTDEQKQGLVQCYLKESEKEFEIPTDKLQMLNSFIDENLRNRRNSTDYELLHRVSGMMTNDVHIKDRHTNPITKPFSEEQTKDVALQFFKGLDQELYEKVKNILDGKSDFAFNMYQLNEDEDFSKTKDDGLPVHIKTACVMSKDGKSAIYVPCKGTIEDIYLLVHELSHTFDFIENDNPTRNLMGEITPHCFEAMLSQYLLENGIATIEDVVNREKGCIISHFDDGVETFAKLELMRIKEQQGEIKQDDIIQMQKKYGITNGQLGFVLGRLAQSEPNVDYRARYMIAQLVYPHYMEQYKQNPQKAIQTLKDYFEQIKANKMTGGLETLGIEPSIEAIPQLIQECNKRLQYIEHIGLAAEKGKDGFADCIEDDKTRLSAMQKAIKTTRNNVLGNESIEYTNDEQNLE
ncbi:MAG: hypothetical protein IKF17_02405 [Clostridia bacterium]|nr:hypothetical protein [Clostridia bacterium]